MEISLLILLVLLTKSIVGFVRNIVAANVNGYVTQLLAWGAGVLVVHLVVWANWAGMPNDPWPRILWGLLLASAAGAVHELLKAIAKCWQRQVLLPDRRVTTPS